MARKYEYTPGKCAYALERCEERLLIAYYCDVEPRLRANAIWQLDFENRFFTNGEGVSEGNLKLLNSERRRNKLDEFEARETHASEYPRLPDRPGKAKFRQDIRDEYKMSDMAERRQFQRAAKAECDTLTDPHFTHEEWVAMKPDSLGGLSAREMSIREHALATYEVAAPVVEEVEQPVEQLQLPAVIPPSNPEPRAPQTERMIRLLGLATRPETRDRILQKITSDEALEVAESGVISDPDVIDELVNRVLDDL